MANEITPSSWPVSTAGAAGAAVTATYAANANASHYVTKINVVVSTAALTNLVTIILKDGTTAIWQSALPASAAVGQQVTFDFPFPLKITKNSAPNLVVSASTGTSVVVASMSGYTK